MVDDTQTDGASSSQPAQLVVKFGALTLVLGNEDGHRKVISMGRDKTNDLVAPQKFVSRRHATIEVLRDRFVFTDLSANGTYVLPEGQEMLHIHGAKVFLEGAGVFSLGLHLEKPESLRIEYRCEPE